MKLKLSILALFILVAISVKGAVVDTLAVYSEAMKKNVQVVVVLIYNLISNDAKKK